MNDQLLDARGLALVEAIAKRVLEVLDVRDVEAMQSSCHILDDHLDNAFGGSQVALRDARNWIQILARLAAVIDKLDPRWAGREGSE